MIRREFLKLVSAIPFLGLAKDKKKPPPDIPESKPRFCGILYVWNPDGTIEPLSDVNLEPDRIYTVIPIRRA